MNNKKKEFPDMIPYLWDEVVMEHHWKIQKLKESTRMLSLQNPLNRPSIDMNTIWEPVIQWDREKLQ